MLKTLAAKAVRFFPKFFGFSRVPRPTFTFVRFIALDRTARPVFMGFLLALLVMTLLPVGAGETERQVFNPQSCQGWDQAALATRVEVPSRGSVTDFSTGNSATFSAPPGLTPEALNQAGSALGCSGWNIPLSGFAPNVDRAALTVSLGAAARPHSEDVVVVRTSIDGRNWTTRSSFVIDNQYSNERNGGYTLIPLDDITALDTLRRLQVEVVPALAEGSATRLFVDHIGLAADVTTTAHAKTKRLDPATCVGWSNADQAKRINYRQNTLAKDFSDRNVALIQRFADANPTVGNTDQSALTCETFGVLKATKGRTVIGASIVVSLAARSGAPGTDAVIIDYSLDDGATWQAGTTTVVTGEDSNASRGGYLIAPITGGLDRANLAPLKVRVRYVAGEEPADAEVRVDGIGLDVSTVPEPDRAAGGLSFLARSSFLPLEEPVIVLEEGSLLGYEVTDSSGRSVDIQADTKTSSRGVEVIVRRGRQIRPGTYTVKLKAKQGRRIVEETQSFTWGVASINTPKSSYALGEAMPIVLGVVDVNGRTVCDADLQLDVESPRGDRRSFSTKSGTVSASATCGPKSITDAPDYLVRIVAEEAGLYRMKLTVQTADGPQSADLNVQVTAVRPFTIERIAPSRINPKQNYRVRLIVQPDRDHRSDLIERVPSGMVVSEISNDGRLEQRDGEQVINWPLDLKANREVELSYVIDAPDVAPALFTLGPAALDIVGEPRQWQIASDEIVERRGREFAYESIPPAVHDWDAIQDNLLETTKPIYGPGETVAIQSWSDGFADDENPKRPTSLRDLTVRGPDGSIVDPPRATETLNNLGRRRDNVYLGPPDDFRPGVYTVSAVTAEGNDVSSSFEWGTLGISIDQPQPKVRSLLRFDITTLNDFGANKCDDALRLTIDRPDGERRVFDSRDGSLRVCPDGRSGAVVEFSPSLTGQYRIELRRIRDGVERFVQQSFSANDRAATPKNVRAEMEKAVKAEADTFRTGDRPRLRVRVEDSAVFGFLGVDGTSRRVTNIEVTDPTGRRVAQTAGRSTERQGRDTDELLDIDTSSFTTAGKYTAHLDVEQGEYAETIEQDFTWGVLAVNLRRATERPETETEIGMAVLDDQGRTLCDTQLELTIRDPNGRRQTMRTDDGIDRNPKCRDKSVTNEFDYRALYRIGRAGTYELTLTARTVNGERTMTDSFEVRPDPAFDIERSVYSMRIYPLENYPVVIGVTPRADYRGPVVESLPESLRVIDLPVGVSETVSNGRRLLTWDVDWKAGERHELTYTLDYPDVSPAFYMAGPLQISDYREARPWQIASDSVTPSGTLGFSETAADDNMQWLTHTSPSTYTDQGGSVDTTTNANDLVHVVVKNAPTRNELLAGQIETNGTMHITRRDSSAVWTEELEVASVTATQTCDTTAGACNLGFNMAYEQLGGRAIVFYGKAANDGILYYNIWNGTSWAGEASTTFRASSTFDTRFVVAKPERGTRSNRILVMVSDADNDIYAMIFDGGTPGDLTTITGTSSNTLTKNFDGDWEGTTRNAVVFWGEAETAATNPYRYKVYSHGTDTWDGSATNPGNAHGAVNIGRWINVAAHLSSNRMAVLLMGSASDTRPAIWKNDDTSAGLIFGNEDALAETPLDNWGDVEWENYNGGTPVAMFVYSANAANADASAYQTWTSGTGFSAETDMPLAMGDDSAMWKLYSSPNNDEMMAVGIEFSDDLCFQRWSGTAWDSDCTTTEYSTTLPPDTATTHNEQDAFDFSYTPYSPWSRNWQFFADQTAADPTTTLANENVTPTAFDSAAGKFRLRFSVAELGGLAQIDARKKLQYTTGSPDDPAATWTDVDDPVGGGIWRYYDCDGGSSTCNDGTALTGTANLSGSPVLGWWTQDKDAAAGTAMDQTAETVRELEYAVEANGATASTTYYFRMYDLDIQAPVLREQDNDGANDCATATCTYPSLTTASNSITLSGRCFTDETEVTACTNDGATSIKVAVNGSVDAGSATDESANPWSFTITPPASGATLVFFIDGETTESEEATTVVKYDGSGSVDNIRLYLSQLVVGTDSGSANTDQTISTSDLESTGGNGYENGDDAEEDVMYSVANSDLTVDDDNNKTEQFYIMHGETYRPASGGGGDTTTHHLEIDSTAVITADSNAFNVAGDFTNGGTFTANTSTVTFNGAAAQTVVTNAQGFNAIVVNNTGTTGTGDDVTISGALDVNGTLTITDGDLQLATNDPNVTTAGDVNLNASTALVTKADNGTATWTFDGTGTSTWTDSATTTQDLGLVIIDGTTKTVNMGSSVRATKLTVTDTFGLASSGYTLTLTGTGQAAAKPLTVTGTFNEGTNSTVDYIGNGATDITLETYWNLSVRPAGTATHYVPSAATMNVSGNLIVGDGANAGTFNLSTNAASIDVNGNVTINASAVLSASGSGDIWVGGSYANSGTFTSNSGNFTFDATSSGKTVSGSLTGANAFGKLTFNGTNGEWTIQNSMDVTDSFDVGAGTLIHGANTTLAVTGATFTLTAGITWTKTSGTGKLLLDNVTELLFADNTTPKQNLGAVQIGASPGTTTLSTDMSADSVTIPTGDTFNTKGYEVTTTGAFDCQGTCTLDLTSTGGEVDGTIIDVGGDFTMSSSATFTSFTNSKIFINATSGNKTFTTGGKAYFDVELKNTDGTNDDITISGSPFDINGALTLTDGQIRLDTNDPNVTLAGSLSIAAAATVTKADNGTATWTFDGTGTSTWTDSTSGVQDLGLVAINGTTKTINLGSNAKATKLTIAASQTFGLGSSGYSFTLTGSGTALNQPFQNSGTLNEGTNSTFIFAGTDGTTLDPETFYNLTIAPSGGAGPLYTLDYNETTNPTNVLGNFTLGDNTNAVSLNCPAFANFDIDGDVLIRTSATMISSGDTGMVYIGGSYTNNGTYTEGGNGLTFNATTTGKTINGNLTGANAMAIIFNGSGGEWTNTAALDAVTIVMTAGTFAGTANVTTTNQVIGTAGIINRTGGTFEIRPNLNINIGPTTASTNWTFNNLTFGNSHASTGLTVTKQSCATCGMTVTGTLSIGKTGDAAATTLNAGNATWTLSGTGQTPLSILASPAGTLTASTSTFNYSGANGVGNVDVTAATYNNLGVGTTSDGTAETYVLAGDTTVGSVLTVGNASSGASDALDGSTRTLTLSGSGTPLVLTSQGTYTASSSTVNYTGTPSTITIAGTTYNNLGVGTTSDSNAVTYQLGGNTSVGSVLTVGNSGSTNNDTLDGSSRTLTLSGSGTPLNFTSRGVFSASTSTVNFTGGSATNVPGVTYNNVGIGDGATVTYTTLATPTVGGALVLAANSTLALGFGHTLNLNTSTCSLTLPASATISGTANLYWYCNSNTFPTTGTINLTAPGSIQFVMTADFTLPARDFAGSATVLFLATGVTHTVTLGAGTMSMGGNFQVYNSSFGDVIVNGSVNNTTITAAQDFSFVKSSTGSNSITSGTGTWTFGGNVNFTNGTYTATAGNTLKMTGASKQLTTAGNALSNFELVSGTTLMVGTTTINNDLTLTSGTLTAPSSGALNIGGHFTNNAAFTHNSSTVTMSGTTKNITGSSATTFNSLTISGTTSVATSSPIVNTLLTVDVSKSLTIGSGLTLTLANTGTGALTLNGTINGPGRLTYRSSDVFPTGGALGAVLILRYDMSVNNMTTAVRTDYGTIEAYNASGAGRTLTLGNGTHTLSGDFDLQSNAASSTLVLEGSTNNPAVNVTGNVTTSVATAAVTLSLGSNTWTVGGNFDLTNVTTFNNNSGTLVMNGTGTMTSNGKTLFSVTLSGTITLANATHTINGNLSFAGGTITAGTSTITMTGTGGKTITGGGATIYALNIDPSSAATVTLQTSDLTVANQLTVATGDTLTLSSANLTNTFGTNASIVGTLASSGTGKLIFPNGAGGPGTTGTLTARVRYDATSGDIAATTVDGRSYRGGIEFYSSSASNRVITLSSTNMTAVGTNPYYFYADGNGNLTVESTTNNPASISTGGGDIDFLGSGSGTEIFNTGTGSLVSNGNVDFTGGTFTSAGTLAMNGTTKTLTTGGNTINNFTSSSAEMIPAAGSTITLTGNFDISTGVWLVNGETIVMSGAGTTFAGGYNTFNNLTVDPATAGTVTVTSDAIINGQLTVATGDTLSIDPAVAITSALTTSTATIDGTISGSGAYWWKANAAFPTGGTVSSEVWFVNDNDNDLIISARTYGGKVVLDHGLATNRTTVLGTAGGQTFNFNGGIDIRTDGTGNVTLKGDTYAGQTVNVTGNVIKQAGVGSGVLTIISGTGTWTVNGNVDFTGITFTATSGNALKMTGTTKTLTSNGNALHHFEIAGGSTTMSGTTTLNGDMTLTSGTLTAPATLNVNGNWSNAGGVFVEGTNTVNLVGATSVTMNSGCATMATCADNEFYNLIVNKTDAADGNDNVTLSTNGLKVTNTLTITDGELVQSTLDVWATGGTTAVSIAAAGKWNNISTGDLKLGGPFTNAGVAIFASGNSAQCSDVADDIVITSTVGGTQRLWSGAGTFTIRNVNVTDMTDSSISVYTSTLSNTTWTVVTCGIDVSGTIYQSSSEGTAYDCSGGNTVNLRAATNGGSNATGQCTAANGTFTISGVSDPGAADIPMVVFIDSGDSTKATTVTLSAAGATPITGLTLIMDRVVVTQQSATALTNAHMNTADNTSAGIRYAVSAGNLTVESGMELHVLSGKVFTPGGTVTTTATGTAAGPAGDLHIAGTLTMGTNSLTVGGDYNNAGTLNKTNSQTTTLAATGSGFTITPGTGDFNNLTVSGDAGGNGTYTLSGANLTVDGTLTVNTGDTLTIDTSRTLTNTGATDVNNDGTINGAGTLQFTSASGGPDSDANSTGTYSAVTRYNATGGNIASTTFDARTYSGRVELYQDSTTTINRTVTPATDGTYTLSGSSSHLYLINDDAGQTLTLAGGSASATFTIGGNIDYTGGGASSEIIQSGNDVWTVAGGVDLRGGTYTATSGNELKMTGTADLYGNNQSLYKLTIDGSGTTVTAQEPFTITNALTVGGAADSNNDTFNLNAIIFSTSTGSVVFGGSGTDTINGNGTLIVRNDAVDTDGAFGGNVTVKYDTYQGVTGLNVVARQYRYLSIDNYISEPGQTVTLGTTGGETITVEMDFTIDCGGCELGGTPNTIDGDSFDPTVNVTGNVVTNDPIGGTHTISMGSGTWTVGGNFDLTYAGTFNHNSGTLVMNGTGTLTSNGKTLNNFTTSGSGTITLASATHTFAGNIVLGSSATLTPGTSTVVMNGTTKTIDGGGKTLYAFTVSGSTTTLQNTDLTVSNTLTISASQTLAINASRTLTHTGATLTWGNGSSTISGSGTLRFTDASGGPGTGGVISAVTRFDATNGNVASTTIDARTYSGVVEIYSNSTSARTVTLDSVAYVLSGASSHLHIIAANAADLTLAGDTNNPTVTIGGNLDFTGTGEGYEVLAAGNGTWTVSGNVDFTNGFYGPSVAIIAPTLTDTVERNRYYDSFSGCALNTQYYCLGTANFGMTEDTDTCIDSFMDRTENTDHFFMKFNPTGITDGVTILSAQVGVQVTAAYSQIVIAGRSSTDDLTCDVPSSTFTATSGSQYGSVDLGATGNKVIPLGATGVADVQSRITGTTSRLTVSLSSSSFDTAMGGLATSVSRPALYVSYYASGTPTLVMNGTSKTLTSAGNALYNLTLSGTITLANATHTVGNNLDLTGGTVTPGTSTVVMTGPAATLTGSGTGSLYALTIDPPSAGTVTLATGGGDLTVSSVLNVATGDTLSLGANRTLTLSATIGGSLTLTGTISGSGRLTYKTSTAFPTTGIISSILRFDTTSTASQTISSRDYDGAVEIYNNSGGAKTIASNSGTMIFSTTLDLSVGSGSVTLDLNTTDPTTTTVTGALTIGANATLSAPSTNAFNVNGHYTNNGTFTDNGGTVTLAGAAQQDFAGTMTGTSDFNNVVVTNAFGDGSTTWSVTFATNAATAGTFTAATANTKLRFNAGSTFTFAGINFNGQATGTRVFLRSSTPGSLWYINAGNDTVLNADVRDSDACASTGGAITPTDPSGTNYDSGNTICWDINQISFSISDLNVGFGSCTPSAARYATGDSLGAAADSVDAHTLTLSTNARTGYALTVFGSTLTSSAGTITGLGGTATASIPGTEQFGLRAIKNSGAGTVTSPFDTSNWAFNAATVPQQIASHSGSASTTQIGVRYLCNVSEVTEASSYSTDLTYVLTATF